jgi:hypothetical protein
MRRQVRLILNFIIRPRTANGIVRKRQSRPEGGGNGAPKAYAKGHRGVRGGEEGEEHEGTRLAIRW